MKNVQDRPLVHVVLIAWSPTASTDVREQARAIARSFSTSIPGIVSVVEGPSISQEALEGPFDYGMVITFANAAALDEYLPHPVHRRFVSLLDEGGTSDITVYDLA